MRAVYKYNLVDKNFSYICTISAPKGAEFLYVGNQHEEICVWAEVDTDNEMVDYQFEIFATGEEIKNDMGIDRKYLNSVMLNSGYYVFHIYQRIN